MTTFEGWLIDKSALVRLPASPDHDTWLNRIQRGLVMTTPLTLAELGFSAVNARTWTQLQREPPLALMPVVGMNPRAESRALEVQGLLASCGYHRAVGVADLFIAAAAEESGLTLLHVDKDFELIAKITAQPVERLRGDL
ncbi:MAG: PIN domain nuclease [Microlunatus sp.]